MSRSTDAGDATVTTMCALFSVSRAAYYAALGTPAPPALRARPARGVPAPELLRQVREILAAHPAWGHRKVWATLRRRQVLASRRRVAELMRANGEMQAVHGARSEPRRSGSVVVAEPNRRFATDLTTVWTRRDGLVAVTLTVDCGCRSVLDVTATVSQASGVVLGSVDRAFQAAFGAPELVPEGVELRSDHGPQYTGRDAAGLAERWRFTQTFAPVGRPTGNALAERTIQTMKIECLWLADFEDVDAVQASLQHWQRSFNEERPHQALGWKTPAEVRAQKLGGGRDRKAA
jgi:putative transposase